MQKKIGFFLGPLAFIFILIIGPFGGLSPQGQSVFAGEDARLYDAGEFKK